MEKLFFGRALVTLVQLGNLVLSVQFIYFQVKKFHRFGIGQKRYSRKIRVGLFQVHLTEQRPLLARHSIFHTNQAQFNNWMQQNQVYRVSLQAFGSLIHLTTMPFLILIYQTFF